ncbi:MAG: BatD family protein [Gammaproteobacteria bacterium]|nr:BatD family protein [Gammaproteobacteria bacterium]
MVRLALLMLCTLLAAPEGHAAGGSFTAAVDRRELYQNEHVVFTLSLADSDTRLRAEGVAPNIDLTLLTGLFELGVPRSDFRFNIARAERRSTSELTVELFPRRSGNLIIPAFTVDGLSTQPIALKVLPLPADAGPEVFTRSGITRRTLYVGEQTQLYLDLYYRTSLKTAEFGAGLETEPLQIEAHALPVAERSEDVGGLEYSVTRSAWAVSPQSDAPVTFHLPALWIETRAGKKWRLPAEVQRLTVRPLPADVPAGTLAARPLLAQTAFETAVAGRIVPWQITLQAAAGLNTLPEQLPFAPAPGDFKLYFDPPERRLETRADGGVDSIAVYSGYLMPLTAGAFTAPALELPYYDAERGTVELAVLPGQALQVAAGESPAPETTVSIPETPAPVPSAAGNGIAALTVWQSAAAIFLLAWLITLGLWWRRPEGRRLRRGETASGPDSAGHPLKQKLLAALGGARTLEQGLREWERHYGADQELRAAVRAVQHLCYQPSSAVDETEIRKLVARAISGARDRRPVDDSSPDDWSPQVFRPVKRQ